MLDFEVKINRMGGGYFQTKFRDPKTGFRKRKRFPNLKEAKSYKKRIEDLVHSKGCHAFSDLRVTQAMEDYLGKFPDSKVRERKKHFLSFIDTLGHHRVSTITANDLQEWMEKNQEQGNLSNRTMNSVKSQLNGFFRHLKTEGVINQNPMLDVHFKRFDIPRKKRVLLSIEEVRTALENAKRFSPDVLYPYLACAAHTGARKGEIIQLNRGDIDFKTGLIHFRKTKNFHERFVRISPMLEGVLQEVINHHEQEALILDEAGGRLHSQQVQKLMCKFKAFFPIENKGDWSSHSLRHSFAYNFLKRGGQMYQLQAILGHRSIDVTVDLYGQLQAQDIDCPSPYEMDDSGNTAREQHGSPREVSRMNRRFHSFSKNNN